MNTFEPMLYRSAVGFAWWSAAVAASGRTVSRRSVAGRFDLHVKRNLFHYTGQNLWFFAVMQASRSASSWRSSSPTRFWVALLAPFLLGEQLKLGARLGAILGFSGCWS